MTALRPELPELPRHMRGLPIDARGYPVPWFVLWQDEKGEPCERGHGTPEFRMQHPNAVAVAHNKRKCWVCGDRIGKFMAFTVGSMCAVNRVSGEPPSHLDCADWAARACPFLSRPHARRREAGMPEGVVAPGISIRRNPGVALVWATSSYRLRKLPDDGGVLFDMSPPHETRWYCEGRPATRPEILESIETGMPALREVVQGNIIEENALENYLARALHLVPA